MIGYKGFDNDMKCLNKQYKEGETYKTDKLEICSEGIHFCGSPKAVFNYYPILDARIGLPNKFALVEAKGDIVSHEVQDKYATNEISIYKTYDLRDYITDWCKSSELPKDEAYGKIMETAKETTYKFYNNFLQVGIVGDFNSVKTMGDKNRIAVFGHGTNIRALCDSGTFYVEGESSSFIADGDQNMITSIGPFSRIEVLGYRNIVNTKGNKVYVDVYGTHNEVFVEGKGAHIWTTGEDIEVNCPGENATITCLDKGARVRAGLGSSITLVEYDKEGNIVCSKTAVVDGKDLDPQCFYTLVKGRFIKSDKAKRVETWTMTMEGEN